MVKKGNIPWNKGLTKESDPRVARNAESIKNAHWAHSENREQVTRKLSECRTGKEPWNKGLTGFQQAWNKGIPRTVEDRKKMSEARKNKWTEAQDAAHWSRGDKRDEVCNAVSKTRSERIASGEITNPVYGYINGWYTASTGECFFYRSSWELRRLNELEFDDNVIRFTMNHGIVIEYEVDGKIHRYIPDILVETLTGIILEEVKGYDGDETVFVAKCDAAERYCEENNMQYRIVRY